MTVCLRREILVGSQEEEATGSPASYNHMYRVVVVSFFHVEFRVVVVVNERVQVWG